jgi:hypothetical protein
VGALEALHRSPFSFNGIVIFGFYCLLFGYLVFVRAFSRAGSVLSSPWLVSAGSHSSGRYSPNINCLLQQIAASPPEGL